MRKYYEEPDFKAVIFESSDVIMTSFEDFQESSEWEGWTEDGENE